MRKTHITAAAILFLSVALSGCSGMSADEYFNIPAGHVAKVLTPNGWQEGVLEAGQVNLGGENMDNQSNSLVFLEATAVQVKEQFDTTGGDNRIITAGREGSGQIPLAVDVYLRLRVPADEALRNRVFAEITPQDIEGQDRASKITVASIYRRYAMQEARSLIRQIVGSYADDLDINSKRSEIEQRLTTALLQRLQQLGVPLELQSVSLSNVAADPQIQANRNQSSGALAQVAAIEQIGAALSRNPLYVELQRVEAMERVAAQAAAAGHPPTFIIGIEGNAHAYAARAAN